MKNVTYYIAVYGKDNSSSDTLLNEQLVNPSEDYLKGYLKSLHKICPNNSIIYNKI